MVMLLYTLTTILMITLLHVIQSTRTFMEDVGAISMSTSSSKAARLAAYTPFAPVGKPSAFLCYYEKNNCNILSTSVSVTTIALSVYLW